MKRHEDATLHPTSSRRHEEFMSPSETLRTIREIRGIGDMRVEDFIRVRKVRTRTTHPAVLLDLILAEKIKDNAIRFETVETFEELYSYDET